VIGMANRGHHAKIAFDFDDPMGLAPVLPVVNAFRPVQPGH